jgi:hypothetical protein
LRQVTFTCGDENLQWVDDNADDDRGIDLAMVEKNRVYP